MAGNKNLNSAARAKKDKFYTQLEDIENELRHYKDFFAGKIVFCNCDDPFESNFFKYFAANFNALELKKLITTSYADSPIAGQEIVLPGFEDDKKGYLFEVDKLHDWNGDGRKDIFDVQYAIENGIYKKQSLTGDKKYCAGDFRSEECIELLQQADVVVTNPPFSLFREYVKLLVNNDKKFIIIGNINAVTYKEIFPMIMANKIWLGESIHGGDREFRVPDDYPLEAANCRVDEDGIKYLRIKGVRWFTNVPLAKFREDIPLYKKYSPEEFPRYDNYDAINVNKTAEIPCDYFGVMGVPITFLDKYNPDQFEILGITDRQNTSGLRTKKYIAADDENYNDLNARSVLRINDKYKPTYARILIRRKPN